MSRPIVSREDFDSTLAALEILRSSETGMLELEREWRRQGGGNLVALVWGLRVVRGAMLFLISTTGDWARPRLDQLSRVLSRRP